MTSAPESEDPQAGRRSPRTAYQAANWHVVRAGLILAHAGVRKEAPEMEAHRLALRALNIGGGIEPPKAEVASQITKEKPHGYRFGSGPRSGGPGKVA